MIPTIAAAILSALGLAGAILHLVAARRWQLRGLVGTHTNAALPPITHWRAVKKGVSQLAEKLEGFIRTGRPDDQFLIGLDAGSPDLSIAEAVRAQFPDHDIAIVACDRQRAANPKIAKFIQMAPLAKHAHWLLTDSEALLDEEFVHCFRQEWAAGKDAALTAGYRFSGLHTVVQSFDAAPALLTLWPGLMLVRRVDFTLGAATGVQAAHVAEIGGWQRLSQDLAEDRQLGALLVARGHSVGLSRQLLTIESDPQPWPAWLKHQHRVAVTYRKATAAGALGLPILHATPLALTAGLIGPHFLWWSPVAAVYFLRLLAAGQFSRRLRFPLPRLALAVAIVPLLESFFWLLAWLPLPVWWSGKWRFLK